MKQIMRFLDYFYSYHTNKLTSAQENSYEVSVPAFTKKSINHSYKYICFIIKKII